MKNVALRIAQNKKSVLLSLIIVFVAASTTFAALSFLGERKKAAINNYEACVASGGSVRQVTNSSECRIGDKTFTPAASSVENRSGWSERFPTINDVVTVSFPIGWQGIIRPLDRDAFYLPGTTQPTAATGRSTEVTDIATYDNRSPYVFSLLVSEDPTPQPEGTATDFSFGEDDSIAGKKYTQRYSKDTETTNGRRSDGDMKYTYVFTIEDEGDEGDELELRIEYNVYQTDPRNQVDLVDEMVRTIAFIH